MNTEVVLHGGEVVSSRGGPLMPAATINELVERKKMLDECVSKLMTQDRDYGVIPGVKDGPGGDKAKMTLLKPGAEKLCTFFGLTPDFQDDRVIVDFEKGLFLFSYRCILLRNARQEIIDGRPVISGQVVGTGVGSANSREKKFRRDLRTCPACGLANVRRSKKRDDDEGEPGWYCWGKTGGCGANFSAADPGIVNQTGQTSPLDSADQLNNMQKMGCKRALVAAVLIATNASELFTQDLEDSDQPPAAQGQERQGRPEAKGTPPKKNGQAPKQPPADGAEFEARVQQVDRMGAEDGLWVAGALVASLLWYGKSKGWPEELVRWPAAAWDEGGKLAKATLMAGREKKEAGEPIPPLPGVPQQQPPADAPQQPAAPDPAAKIGPAAIAALQKELARIGENWAGLVLNYGPEWGGTVRVPADLTYAQLQPVMTEMAAMQSAAPAAKGGAA